MNNKLIIGKILKPQGIKGEIKVQPLTDNISRFSSLKKVYINNLLYSIIKVRIDVKYVYLLLDGIIDMNKAEELRNAFIEVERKDSLPLEGDRHYIVDLIDSNIVINNNIIGKLESIDNYGATDIYSIKLLNGKIALLPCLKKTIKSIDVESKIIILDETAYDETVVIN